MNKIIFIVLILSICVIFRTSGAFGRVDVTKNVNVSDNYGIELGSRIAPFRFYDTRTVHDINSNRSYIRVIMIGCIEFPGIYIVKNSITNRELLELAKPIVNHRAHTSGLIIYDLDSIPREVGNNYEEFMHNHPIDGELYNFLSLIL